MFTYNCHIVIVWFASKSFFETFTIQSVEIVNNSVIGVGTVSKKDFDANRS